MAIVAPFRAIIYNLERIPTFEAVVAPPYDVISDEDQDGYYRKDPYNVVRLVLGKKKTGDSDWDNRYTRAADLFKRWELENALVRLQEPSLFLTSITYKCPDTREKRTRWGFIALVRIEDEDSSVILSHEKTFTFHREDRLKLMRACSAQLSPVFGLYKDDRNEVIAAFEAEKDTTPLVSFRDADGYSYRIWQVIDDTVLEDITSKMASHSIIIADGHHRYETARNYRNLMRARHGAHQSARPYEYVMMYLSNITDKGLTILPTHRLFRSYPDFKMKKFLSSVRPWFEVISFPVPGLDRDKLTHTLLSQLHDRGQKRTTIGFFHAGSRNYYLLCLKPGAIKDLGDDLHPSLKKVDVLVLSRLIFQRILGIKREDLDNERIIQYESNTGRVLSMILSGEYQMAFLVNPTKIEQVLEVTGNSLLMPRKSTYFYPKIASGLVFNKLDPRETIHVPGG
jgi:uncharacterized protein (DUF1015 family)